MRTWLVILVVAALAGCLDGGSSKDPGGKKGSSPPGPDVEATLSPVLYDKILRHGGFITATADGAALRYDVWRPDTAEPVPIILVQSPYWSFGGDAKDNEKPTWYIDYFVPRGYAVALGEMRGTRDSGGCWDFGGALDQQDGADMVEALAALPWSNGNVGMLGQSHVGMSQVAAAVKAPPSLKAIVPIAAVTDWYRYLHKEGAPYVLNRATPPAYFAVHASPSTPDVTGEETPENWLLTQAGVVCADNVVHLSQSAELDGDKDAYWQERDLIARAGDTKAAVFLVHGFLDENVKTDHFLDYWLALPDDLPKKAWFGQWPHSHPAYYEWREDLHRWFDFHLKGLQNGILDAPRVTVQDNLRLNRTEADWPTGHRAVGWALQSDGGLGGTSTPAGTVEYVSIPGDDRASTPMGGAAPTFASFVSPRLDAEVHITGEPTLNLTVTLATPDARLIAVLYELRIQGGQRDEITRAYLDARHRNGPSTNEAAPLLTPVEYVLKFMPRDHRVAAGNHLELVLFGNDMGCVMPSLDSNRYAGTCEATGIVPLAHPVSIQVDVGGETSMLWLPTVHTPGPERVLTPLEAWLDDLPP